MAAQTLRLGPLDLSMPPVYTRIVLYYDVAPPLAAMRAALCDLTQSEYAPWTGSMSKDARGRMVVVYGTDGTGVPLAVRSSGDLTYAELRGANGAFTSHRSASLSHPSAFAELGDPALSVIVTEFAECGAAAVAVALHHCVGDGAALFGFVRKWAARTRGEAGGAELALHDRSCVPMSDAPVPRTPPQFRLAPPTPAALTYQPSSVAPHTQSGIASVSADVANHTTEARPAAACITPLARPPSPAEQPHAQTHSPNLSVRLLRLSAASLARLKASASVGDAGFVSTNDALTALLWRAVTRARLLDSGVQTRLMMAMDVRHRQTGIPTRYAGNAVLLCHTGLAAGRLTGAPLSEAAGAVRRAVAAVDREQVAQCVRWIDDVECVERVQLAFDYHLGPDVSFSQWIRFGGAYDFGTGAVAAIRMPPLPIDGLIFLLPQATQGDGADVLVHLAEATMSRLLNDAELVAAGRELL